MGIREAIQHATDRSPFSAFQFANMDTGSDPNYFGFVAMGGSWVIKRLSTSAGDMTIAAGHGDYAAAWADRANLNFMPPDQVL